MASNASASIDFQKIRPLKGSRHSGFEELCVSLFRAEMNNPAQFLRIDGAGGDGGVEAFVELGSKKIIGLQAKFFNKLGASQWRQIQASFTNARRSHPALKVYYVGVPLDLSLPNAQKWKTLQAKARKLRPAVQLRWWGASELIDKLSSAQNAGRTAYWFGTPQFDTDWLHRLNREARNALDTRYTPSHHVRIKVQEILSAFAREPQHVARYYSEAAVVWKAIRSATEYSPPIEVADTLGAPFAALANTAKEQLPRLGAGTVLPIYANADEAAKEMLNAVTRFMETVGDAIDAAKNAQASKPSDDRQMPVSARLNFRSHELRKAAEALYSFHDFLEEHLAADRRRLLITGDAGSGKSHLLANTVEECMARNQPALFLLGEFFSSSLDPWSQMISRLDWRGSLDDLLAALNHAGEVQGLPSLIIIDAVNETQDRNVWLNHLKAFSSRIERWPWVRLVVSCRTDFLQICIPPSIHRQQEPDWAYAHHDGFGEATFEATAQYFAAYNVQSRDLPPLLPEFQNPLFLKTFCEAFERSVVPSGTITLDLVMKKRITRAAALLSQTIDCPHDVTRTAIETLAGLVIASNGQSVPIAEARAKIDALFPGEPQSRSLFHHLCSSGLVTEVGHYDYNTQTWDILVRFAYERFSDYFIAQRLLAGISKSAQLHARWKQQGLLAKWRNPAGYYAHRGILSALAILVPEKFKVELMSVIDGKGVRKTMLQDFLASLPWRSTASITPKSHGWFVHARKELPTNHTLALLLRLATVVDHPFNAQYLDAWLRSLRLWRRDQEWTIPISEQLLQRGESSAPATFVRWILAIKTERLSEKQAKLVAILLCWLFSTNDRGFRRRATLAGIHVAAGRCKLAAELIEEFHAVDDPYIVERVYAIAAGAAVRERNSNNLAPLADAAWRRVFAQKQVPPHILLRDFAFSVLECARNLKCLPENVAPKDYQPPYRSRWPKIWTEKKARIFGIPDGWRTIVHSIEPEYGNGIGGYGDFGRYTMEAHMHAWLNERLTEPYPKKDSRERFDGLVARAWVLQRVAQLGWTPERFGKYENNLRDDDRSAHEETKQERISKKYQWIALHELEGLASDHFHFGRWYDDSPSKFEGAWQLSSRNFDPAQPLRDPLAIAAEPNATEKRWWYTAPNPFNDVTLLKNVSAWVGAVPEVSGMMLQLPAVPGFRGAGLLLNAYFIWDQPESYPPRTRNDGKCHQWLHIRSWLVPKKESARKLEFLRTVHFWGDGIQIPEFGSEGLGEYPWSPRFNRLREQCSRQETFGARFPDGFTHTVVRYSEGDSSASVPSPQLAEVLGLTWAGTDFNFMDADGVLAAFAPRGHSNSGTTPCFVESRQMLEMLARQELALVWAVVGERSCIGEFGTGSVADKQMSFSGVYTLNANGKVDGGLTFMDTIMLRKQPHGFYDGASQRTRVTLPSGKVVRQFTKTAPRGNKIGERPSSDV